jgi:hypothetical protein
MPIKDGLIAATARVLPANVLLAGGNLAVVGPYTADIFDSPLLATSLVGPSEPAGDSGF